MQQSKSIEVRQASKSNTKSKQKPDDRTLMDKVEGECHDKKQMRQVFEKAFNFQRDQVDD